MSGLDSHNRESMAATPTSSASVPSSTCGSSGEEDVADSDLSVSGEKGDVILDDLHKTVLESCGAGTQKNIIMNGTINLWKQCKRSLYQ